MSKNKIMTNLPLGVECFINSQVFYKCLTCHVKCHVKHKFKQLSEESCILSTKSIPKLYDVPIFCDVIK